MTAPTPKWRDLVTVHAAADLFPMMSDAELDDLAQDINLNGLQNPIFLWRDEEGKDWLLDGRNRLEALQRGGGDYAGHIDLMTPDASDEDTDPYDFVVSLNIKRRHLTGEQKRDLIGKLLAADPAQSDRQIAVTAKVSDKTVGKVRREKERTAEIPQLKKRVGADGKSRTAEVKDAAHKRDVRAQEKSSREAIPETPRSLPDPADPLTVAIAAVRALSPGDLADFLKWVRDNFPVEPTVAPVAEPERGAEPFVAVEPEPTVTTTAEPLCRLAMGCRGYRDCKPLGKCQAPATSPPAPADPFTVAGAARRPAQPHR